MRWEMHVTCMGEIINVYTVLVRKHGGNRPLGRPTRKLDDIIRKDLREVGLGKCGLDLSGSG
jgi:hypothetical protein